MGLHAVITGDLVKSRKIRNEDIEPLIDSLRKTFEAINKELLGGEAKYEIFRGDSFQFFMPVPELALLVSLIIRAHLRTYEPTATIAGKTKSDKPILYAYSDARIAIGIGSVTYNANRVLESQGEAFEKSGHAFDVIEKNNDRLALETPWENINNEFEPACLLADALISKWTASTAEAMYHFLLYGKNQTELSEILNISQPAVHKRLSIYGNSKAVQSFIDRYKTLINNVKGYGITKL